MRISRQINKPGDNTELVSVREEYSDHSLFYINLNVNLTDELRFAADYLNDFLESNNLEILLGFVFGRDSMSENEYLLNRISSSLVLLWHTENPGYKIQLTCSEKINTVTVFDNGRTSVRRVNHFDTNVFYINNIIPDTSNNNYKQVYESFSVLSDILAVNNVSYAGLSRTWLYLDDILSWYDTLNSARTNFFMEKKIADKIIPASTGVGLSNIDLSKISLSAIAVSNVPDKVGVKTVESPLQCEATSYKSSFSRAVEVKLPDSRRLYISGTSSIDKKGNSIHKGNVFNQISHTMDVISGLLENNSYSWENITRGIAYFKETSDIDLFTDFCRSKGLDCRNIITVGGKICREELLFEIELDAISAL